KCIVRPRGHLTEFPSSWAPPPHRGRATSRTSGTGHPADPSSVRSSCFPHVEQRFLSPLTPCCCPSHCVETRHDFAGIRFPHCVQRCAPVPTWSRSTCT